MNLTVENLSYAYGRRRVLDGVSFALEQGDFLSVLGPNGAGKSTLFRCILGLLPGYKGLIASDGEPIGSLSRRELARRIAYIPQAARPAFGYSVLDTVLMGTTRQLSPFAQPGKAQMRAALDALERVGAAQLSQRLFDRLSGGEQQLVLIARALAQQAQILVMDEPTSALDYGNQLRVLRMVRGLAEEGYAVLMSTHNPQHALSYATKVLALSNGSVAAFGAAQDVLSQALVRTLYGVDIQFADTPQGRLLMPIDEK